MNYVNIVIFATIALFVKSASASSCVSCATKPNIILILADDLSPASVGAYGATMIKTPNIDRLAQEGRMFHHAYAPTSICSPTRYALLSGRYSWRNERHPQPMVLPADGALAFAHDEPTLPAFLQSMGYTTAVIGKWHIGFGDGDLSARYDWTQSELKPGPLEIGFDYFFGLVANPLNEPHLYVENHSFYGRGPGDIVKWVNQPDGGMILEGWKPGLRWELKNIASDTTRKAVDFIERSKDKPFFFFIPPLFHMNRSCPQMHLSAPVQRDRMEILCMSLTTTWERSCKRWKSMVFWTTL
jgi:arylsulfatase A-like enzyme